MEAFHARGSGKAPRLAPRASQECYPVCWDFAAREKGPGFGPVLLCKAGARGLLALSRCTSNSVPLRPPSPRTDLVVPACVSLVREAGSSPWASDAFSACRGPLSAPSTRPVACFFNRSRSRKAGQAVCVLGVFALGVFARDFARQAASRAVSPALHSPHRPGETLISSAERFLPLFGFWAQDPKPGGCGTVPFYREHRGDLQRSPVAKEA